MIAHGLWELIPSPSSGQALRQAQDERICSGGGPFSWVLVGRRPWWPQEDVSAHRNRRSRRTFETAVTPFGSGRVRRLNRILLILENRLHPGYADRRLVVVHRDLLGHDVDVHAAYALDRGERFSD